MTTVQPALTRFSAAQPAAKNVTPLINANRMVADFVDFAKMDTQSRADSTIHPSTPGQTVLANKLADQLRSLGNVKDVQVDANSVVTATVDANLDDGTTAPVIGLVSHMDTSDQAPASNVQPTFHNNYQGGDLVLNGGTMIPASDLTNHIGEDIITSDGTTLLGADDKSGIAEILEAVQVWGANPDIQHPKVRIAFTPDEETAEYIDQFDIKKFGADYAYTIDGDAPEAIEDSSLNAHKAQVSITGRSIHPGYAYGKMINATELAGEFMAELPADERPQTTKDDQGYYFPYALKGSDSEANMTLLVRDFDWQGSLRRIQFLKDTAAKIEARHSGSTVAVAITEQYRNFAGILAKYPQVAQAAEEGLKRTGLKPQHKWIRGGTDGCTLTANGLPTPNLGAGGFNFHSKREFVTKQDMVRCCANIINTLSVWAERATKAPTAATTP